MAVVSYDECQYLKNLEEKIVREGKELSQKWYLALVPFGFVTFVLDMLEYLARDQKYEEMLTQEASEYESLFQEMNSKAEIIRQKYSE